MIMKQKFPPKVSLLNRNLTFYRMNSIMSRRLLPRISLLNRNLTFYRMNSIMSRKLLPRISLLKQNQSNWRTHRNLNWIRGNLHYLWSQREVTLLLKKLTALIDRLKFLQTRFENRYQPLEPMGSPVPIEKKISDYASESLPEPRRYTSTSAGVSPDSKKYMDLLESFIFIKDQKKHK